MKRSFVATFSYLFYRVNECSYKSSGFCFMTVRKTKVDVVCCSSCGQEDWSKEKKEKTVYSDLKAMQSPLHPGMHAIVIMTTRLSVLLEVYEDAKSASKGVEYLGQPSKKKSLYISNICSTIYQSAVPLVSHFH